MTPGRSLRLSPSYPLAGLIVGAQLAAGAALVLALPGWAGASLAAALAALGLASAWSRALLRAPRSARAIRLEAAAGLVELANGERLAIAQAGTRHVSRLLVTLPLRRRTLLVSADMLDRDSFRALRVWALWGRLPGAAGKPVAQKQLAA